MERYLSEKKTKNILVDTLDSANVEYVGNFNAVHSKPLF
jgi:hypothetical protein